MSKPCPACGELLPPGPVPRCPLCGERLLELSLLDDGTRYVHPLAGIAFFAALPTTLVALALTVLSKGQVPILAVTFVLSAGTAALSFDRLNLGRHRQGISLALAITLGLLVFVGYLISLPAQLVERHHHGHQTAAIGALKTISSAQALFREADKERDGNLDYGTLAELGIPSPGRVTGLIDPVLASGTKNSYVFQVGPSRDDPENRWFGVASPIDPEEDERWFCVNQDGVTFYTTTGPFWFNDRDCQIPPGAVPVGR